MHSSDPLLLYLSSGMAAATTINAPADTSSSSKIKSKMNKKKFDTRFADEEDVPDIMALVCT